MRLTQFEHFVSLVEEKNYSKASDKCFVSRQAISNSVRSLEDELGLCLVQLDHRNQPTVTDAGREVYRQIKKILSSVDSLRDYALSIKSKEGALRIAFSDTLAPVLCNDLMNRLRLLQNDPGNSITEIVRVSNNILAENNNNYDLSFFLGDGSLYPKQYRAILSRYPMVLTIPFTSELYKKEKIYLSDLRGQSVIYPVTPESFHIKEIQDKYDIHFLSISNLYSAAHTSIEQASCILDAEDEVTDSDLIQKPIQDWRFEWDVLAVWKTGVNEQAVQRLLEKLRG